MDDTAAQHRDRSAPVGRERRRRPTVSVITPTYNEAGNIEPLLDAVGVALSGVDHEIIVVDDDSPDLTWQVAERYAERHRNIRVIRRFGASGLSSAVLAGMEAADGDVLAVIDADLQHDESILPEMVDRIVTGAADVVVGTRATDGGSYGDFGPFRHLISSVAAIIARLFLRVPLSDPMSGFFALSADLFERKGPTINPQGFKILLEFIGRNRDLRIEEVGYSFRKRSYGETKLSPSVIRSYLLAVFELRLGRQVKGQFVMYALVGAFGLVVNVVGFSIGEALGLGSVDTGVSDWIDPLDLSVLLGIQLNIVSNFLLNNYFTFWERRFRGWWLLVGFAAFQVVSIIGGIVQVSVFRFLDSTGFGWDAIGREPSRYLHNGIGMLGRTRHELLPQRQLHVGTAAARRVVRHDIGSGFWDGGSMERRRFLSTVGVGLGVGAAGVGLSDVKGRSLRSEARTASSSRAFAASGGIGRLGATATVWSVATPEPFVSLTFDDGPDPAYTYPILETLAAAGASATFNMMGFNVAAHPEIVEEVVASGHEIGNHTATHTDLATVDLDVARSEINGGLSALRGAGVADVRWFRPPRGDLTGVAMRAAAEAGHDILMWSVDGHPRGHLDAQRLAADLADTIEPGDVVCLHDGLGRGTFSPDADFAEVLRHRRSVEVEALPSLLASLTDRGISCVTAGQLVASAAA